MPPIKPIDKVPLPGPVNRSEGIGRASQNVLVRFVVETFNRLRDGISDMLRHAADSILEAWERPLLGYVNPLIDDILANESIPDSLRQMLLKAKSGRDQVGVGILLAVATAAIMYLGPAAFSGLAEKVRHGSFNVFNANVLDFGTWHQANLRDASHNTQMIQELSWQGWTEQQLRAARLAAEQRLGVNEIILANYRGEISETDALTRLGQLGIPPDDARVLFNLGEQIPGPADLVRFALREVWNDGVASQYGYDQGDTGEFALWMEKQGLSSEWVKAYWRAHWEIPSSGQMIEMFHRKQIGYDTLVDGLKVNDIAPGWIDPLLGITYSLLTRVDVKRALRYGLYTYDEVLEEYRQQGYDERRAGILAQIAMKETIDETAGLTRAAIVKAYTKGRLSRSDAIDQLGSIGILGEIASFYLEQADYDRQDAVLDRKVDNVEKRYLAGVLGEQDALSELAALGVPGEEARLDLDDWKLAKQTRVRRPTRSNLDEFFLQGVIGTDSYTQEMDTLGYQSRHVGWYLGSLAVDAARKAAIEEERAQKERKRLDADRRASAYEKAKAAIDQDIAELNAAIADSQVALVVARNEKGQALSQSLSVRELARLKAEYEPMFRDVDAAIAQARLSISEVQTGIKSRQAEVNDYRRSLQAGKDIVLDTRLRNERAARQTEISVLAQQIARRATDVARLKEAIPLAESAEQQADLKQTILELQTEQAELGEKQSDERVSIREIDEQLPVQLTAERRLEIDQEIARLLGEVDESRVRVEELEQGIRETQTERVAIETEYRQKVGQVPGRVEQLDIEAEYNKRIDLIESRIAELRANVAERRLAKADLVVEWRE